MTEKLFFSLFVNEQSDNYYLKPKRFFIQYYIVGTYYVHLMNEDLLQIFVTIIHKFVSFQQYSIFSLSDRLHIGTTFLRSSQCWSFFREEMLAYSILRKTYIFT